MLKNILNILCFTFIAAFSFSCAQNESEFGNIVKDNKPLVPVTFTGTGIFTFGGNPTLPVSVAAGGNIDFTISIPSTSGRTIKELTTVLVGSPVTIATLNSPTSLKFNTAPIPVGATSYKFSTTLAAIKARVPSVNIVPLALPTPPAPPAYRNVSFLFVVTLDNGETIIPVQFDARLMP
jgi:hypothetical protein